MGFVGIKEVNTNYILENRDLSINLNKLGLIDGWYIKSLSKNIIEKGSFKILSANDLSEPYINVLSTTISFEFNTYFGELKRVYSIKEKIIVLDDIIISKNECNINYSLQFQFINLFDYFMVGKEKFSIENDINIEAKDLLLVNEEKNIYIGCIFKESMDFCFKSKRSLLSFSLSSKVNLKAMDMFVFSYTFSLV